MASEPNWEKLSADGWLLGSDVRCIICGQWIPPAPEELWVIVIGEDYYGFAHNYETLQCAGRDTSRWTLCLP